MVGIVCSSAGRRFGRTLLITASTLALALSAAACATSGAGVTAASGPPAGDWPSIGRDPGGQRFSPLDQITPANVGRLTPRWTYDLGPPPGAPPGRRLASAMAPLVVGGVVYLAHPYGRVVALDGDTGAELWSYALPQGDPFAGRAMEYWPGDGQSGPRIIFGTRSGLLMTLDAATGQPPAGFTPINLKTPEVMNGFDEAAYSVNSAPAIYRNLIITGSRVQENPALGPRGDVRAWDIRTGRLAWTFKTIPEPGEPFHDTWLDEGWRRRSGVNIWNQLSVDPERGIAYLAISAPTYDRIGIDRKGDNLFSSSLVAVDAATGKYLWHFQTIHHDIWDHDMPAQPTLVDVKRNGRTIPAVVAVNKSSYVFILDRVTGKPIYDVRETKVPPSTIPGEVAAETQPIPVTPPPVARQRASLAEIAKITPEHEAFCKARVANEKLTFDEPFEPLRTDHPTVRFPGSGGGANWGGGGFDPRLGYYIVSTSEVGSVEQMARRADGSWYNPTGSNAWFADNDKEWMCQEPPWGQLTAVDVNTGRIAWQSTLGVTDTAPEGRQDTGRPNAGGLVITAGGLTFIGATDDSRFRAFDSRTGKELWTVKLPASAHSGPASYLGKSGRQYVAVIAAGGSYLGSPTPDSKLIAYGLPQ